MLWKQSGPKSAWKKLCFSSVVSDLEQFPFWVKYHRNISFPLTQIQFRTYRTLCVSISNATRYPHRLSRSSLMPWSSSGRKSPRTPSADSSGARPDSIGGGHKHDWVTLWVAVVKFTQVWSASDFLFFTLIFGVILNPAIMDGWIWFDFVLNGLYNEHQ